jgi:hypothetical protein
MRYVTHRSYRMPKHKFGVMCPDALFVKSVPAPPKHEKVCFGVWRPRLTGMHHVTCRSHRMQNTHIQRNVSRCNFCRFVTGPIRASKIVHRCFTPGTLQNALCDPHIPLDAKPYVLHNVSWRAFCGIRTSPTPSIKNSASTFCTPNESECTM